MNDLIDKLNEAQRAAVTHADGPLMIVAGAGTGKTRVITYRIAFLHREMGIPLHQILAVTFTNKAAAEMRERICRLLGVPDTPGLAIGTFHARCAMLLRREAEFANLDKNFAILDENDQKQAIKRVLREMQVSEKLVRPGQVQTFINQAKMRLLTHADCKEEFDEDEVPYADIYEKYQQTIEKSKSVDFEDLLMKTVQLFQQNDSIRQRWSNRYRYVLVDEYQDTNHAQFLMTKLLAQDHRQVAVVGDEDQSIYSWRGAEISNLLDFEKTFPGTRLVKLEQNYRSTKTILKAASTVIARNTQRIGKTLFTDGEQGEAVTFFATPNAEAEGERIAAECARLIQMHGVDPNEIAVFYRGHWLSRATEDALRKFRLPYRVVGGMRFYDRAEIKDLLSFLRLAVNPDDDLAFERVMNKPTRGVGPKAQEQIVQHAAIRNRSYRQAVEDLLRDGDIKGAAKKGLSDFMNALDKWAIAAKSATPGEVLEQVLADTRYLKEGVGDPDSIEGEARVENIEELKALVEGFAGSGEHDQLAEFLSGMSLDSNEEQNDGSPKINLLTIHNAKGLEFEHVFCIGLEKGVFPTSRAEESHNEYAVEEERRLFYVAITRARRKLYLSFSSQRNRPEFWSMNMPSIFLGELPPDVFDDNSLRMLKRLLPRHWGMEKEDRVQSRQVVMDDVSEPGTEEKTPRTFYSMTRGSVAPRPAGRSGGKPAFNVGARVVHKYMGAGTIMEMGGRPGWERAFVEFDDGRSQEFVLKFAPLTMEGT
ncbi:UvrD-helicase domain-containing protein [Candidatus Sumerlaeota bacterium]|nr:UvrD-helicase domain-containing protein [Candidatus Sumerlaeota bacterium]